MHLEERTSKKNVRPQTDNSLNLSREQFGHAERSKKTDIQDSNSKNGEKKRHPWTGMSTDSNAGVQTRAMAQRIDNEADPEQLQGAPNPDMNPTVELHRTKEDAIKEFVRKHGTIALDWYIPDTGKAPT